jgi:hypothetical protein
MHGTTHCSVIARGTPKSSALCDGRLFTVRFDFGQVHKGVSITAILKDKISGPWRRMIFLSVTISESFLWLLSLAPKKVTPSQDPPVAGSLQKETSLSQIITLLLGSDNCNCNLTVNVRYAPRLFRRSFFRKFQ